MFDANYEVDALPALSTCVKSFEEPIEFISLLDHFNYVTVDVTADGIYIFFYMMMVTSNLQCSIMDQRSHGNKQLFCHVRR